MRRLWLGVLCVALAAPVWAEKLTTPPHVADAAPVVNIISGNPLTIDIGDDTSMQVYNSNVPGAGQFFPPGCLPGQTADNGVFADVAGTLYAPNFSQHPCGTATGGIGTNTPWTPVSLSPVTGTGTALDPFTEVVVVDAATTGLRLTETITYVNGQSTVNTAFAFSNTGNVAVTWDTFYGADLFLANSDAGIPYLQPVTNAPGGQDCVAQTYTIVFLTTTAADRYSANGYSTVWSEIGADLLSNTVAVGCLDNGAANEWQARTLQPAGTLTINSGVTFTGFVGPPPFNAVVPTLSTMGLAALIVLLALVGYVLSRRASLGA